MADISRRDVIKSGAGALTAAAIGAARPAAAQTSFGVTPEKGASLRVLRWKRYVQGDEDVWTQQIKKYRERTGIEVRVDSVNWEDVRPKAAVAANVGGGPDIVISTYDDPHLFPDKLLDLTALADYLGDKYGGWYDVCKRYGMRDGRWIGLPQGAIGNCLVYRRSHIQAAGFEKFPTDLDGYLKLCQGLKAKGTPAGFALGEATGDGNVWTHWCLWSHGARLIDEQNNVVIASKETAAALDYAKALYQTFVPGTLSWLDPNNNKAFLAGECSLTANGISIYYAAKASDDPKLKAMAEDIDHANFPIGPVGRPTELNLFLQAFAFKYTKYPNAVRDFLRYMWEGEQYLPWQQASLGFVSQPLRAYESNPIWTSDPKVTPYRDGTKVMLDNGYSGKLGYASAAVLADFVIVNMFASAASGEKTVQAAIDQAAKRAERYYKV
jgi:multiple sugar transport system substrate-binding protein